MQKLTQTLAALKREERPGYMMHMVAGFPDFDSSIKIAKRILESGADLLEIQIPFSDPIADGPVIASANEIALENGTTVRMSFDIIEELTRISNKPILIMTYFNIVHRYGVETFCKKASDVGVQGLIIPDYPIDEDVGNELILYCKESKLALIQVVASTTKPERMIEISKKATGFVYCMTRTGITGKKTVISPQTIEYLETVRNNCSLPLAVGFGLSEKSQVKALTPYADLMIVGSALIREYANKPIEVGLTAVDIFMQKLTSS